MKTLIRGLPFVATVWVATYVSKETGEIGWWNDGKRWATKKQCMTAAKRTDKDTQGNDYYTLAGLKDYDYGSSGKILTDDYKPVCYRLTNYSTR